MSIRDQLLALSADEAKNFKHETVDVPELGDGAKVIVRELNIGERNAFLANGRQAVQNEDGTTTFQFGDPNDDIYLVVLSTYEEDGVTRVFNKDDVEALAQGGEKTLAALNRLLPVAARLSGLAPGADGEPVSVEDAVSDAGKDSSSTSPDGSDSLS